MALSNAIERCIDMWQTDGLILAPPIGADEVRRVWSDLEIRLSDDVLQFYTTVGGFQDYTFDKEFFWCLWPWDWLKNRNKESPRDGVMFCDHSIEIETWRVRYENSQHSSVWSAQGVQSAPTLESFLERYLEDPWQLL